MSVMIQMGRDFRRALILLDYLVGEETGYCRFDRHGRCLEHGEGSPGKPGWCPIQEALFLLAKYEDDLEEDSSCRT